MIKLLLFDIDNTLLDFKKCAKFAMDKAFDDWNIKPKSGYFEIFMQANNEFWDQLEKGYITRDELYKRRWAKVFDIIGIEDADPIAFEKDFVKNLYKSHDKVNGVDEILEYLSKKYKMVIVSNSSYEEQKSRLKEADLLKYFDEIFTSEEVGHPKPQVEFFNFVKNNVGDIREEEMLIIGDSIKADINGGINAGIKTCWFDFLKEDKDHPADFTIKDLLDLKEIL